TKQGPDATILPAFAFGIAIVAVTYGLGQISGGHFNPAITIGLVAGGRFDIAHAPGFVIAQLIGATVAAALIFSLLIGSAVTAPAGFAAIANRFADVSLYDITTAALLEAILMALLIIIFMGATSQSATATWAPIAIGAGFSVFYLLTMPLTNAGLNPARSTAAAIFAGPEALGQLWIFWVAPIAGAIAGGMGARLLLREWDPPS
ncbi:MAG: aquaporin, partial [Hyphomicrobiaceae bacterium]